MIRTLGAFLACLALGALLGLLAALCGLPFGPPPIRK